MLVAPRSIKQRNLINKLLLDRPKIIGKGTDININNSAKLPMELSIRGNLSQETREEKNMPSIDCPSPVKYVTGEFESYNIINSAKFSSLYNVGSINIDEGIVTSIEYTNSAALFMYWSIKPIVIKANTKYTIKFKAKTNNETNVSPDVFKFVNVRIQRNRTDTSFNFASSRFIVKNPTLTTEWQDYEFQADTSLASEDWEATIFYVQPNRNAEYIPFSYSIKDICVYEGIEDKPYLPYGTIKNGYKIKTQDMNTQQAVKNLDILTGYELYGETDYYYKKLDKWYVHNEWDKYIITGNEQFRESTTSIDGQNRYMFVLGKAKLTTQKDIFSNYYKYGGDTYNVNPTIHLDGNGPYVWVRDNDNFNTLEKVKEFFKSLYDSNNPMYIIYLLETPTETEITDTTFIEELESLMKLESYYPETNISVEKVIENDETELPILEVECYKSIQSMQDEINELKEKINN